MDQTHFGRLVALRTLGIKLAFGLDDARAVSRAAKKYTLPKASARVNPLEWGFSIPGYSGKVKGRPPKPPTDIMGVSFPAPTNPISPAGVGDSAGTLKYMEKAKKNLHVGNRPPALGEALDASVKSQFGAVGNLNTYTPKGSILQGSPGMMNSLAKDVTGGPLTPRQKIMNNSMLAGHERDELLSTLGSGMQDAGHRSPDVILKEHNRVVTLPEEFKNVGDTYRALRSHGPEGAAFKEHGLEFGAGERLNRRQRRFYSEEMNNSADAKLNTELDTQFPIQPKPIVPA